MRKEIPYNNVSHDYEKVLKEFVTERLPYMSVKEMVGYILV